MHATALYLVAGSIALGALTRSAWAISRVLITTGAVNAMKADPKIGHAEALRRSLAGELS